MIIVNAYERAHEQSYGKYVHGQRVGNGKERRGKVGEVMELEGEEGAGLYLILAEVSIEQKVQQAGSVVKPRVLL